MREHGYLFGKTLLFLQLNTTDVMSRILVCYRMAEEDVGIIVGHRSHLRYSLKCEKECTPLMVRWYVPLSL